MRCGSAEEPGEVGDGGIEPANAFIHACTVILNTVKDLQLYFRDLGSARFDEAIKKVRG
jgi:hypothetical protein